ncbi:50S ribosomal protein L17 [bacterium E08(2017)]|nr:50S ribosomal protein L17 [bacterium E08(2017)]
MRHRKNDKKLGRTSAHKKATMSALVCGLIKEKRIETTLPKAKLARSLAEKMVTIARKNDVASRRLALQRLRRKDCVKVLFEDIAPNYIERNGGYTRIIKTGFRRGDASPMAILEWVDLGGAEPKKVVKEEVAEK